MSNPRIEYFDDYEPEFDDVAPLTENGVHQDDYEPSDWEDRTWREPVREPSVWDGS